MNKLQGKDLINVGIFTAIYFVVMMAIAMLGFIPIFLPLLIVLVPLIGGIVMMLYYSKVQKFGMVSLTGLICGILMLLTGMGYWSIITGAVFGVLADLVLKSGDYKSAKKGIISHGVFSMWIIGNYIPIVATRDSYYQQLISGYGQEYADSIIRYMDDMVIFGNNKKELHKARLQIEKFITEELGLQIKKNWQVFRFDYADRKGKRRGRPLDFMGFKFYRDRTTIRKSILQGIRGKVNRVKRKEKITWVDAGSLLSRLGWIWHSDTYAYYERYIKPYVKVKVLKTLVSKHARKENERNGMVRSRKHHRRETKRAGYNKQPAPCI